MEIHQAKHSVNFDNIRNQNERVKNYVSVFPDSN